MDKQQHLGRYRATHGYQGVNDTELSFDKNQDFLLINKDNNEWWYVQMVSAASTTSNDDEEEGYVPASYLTPTDVKYAESASQNSTSLAAEPEIPELVDTSSFKEEEEEEEDSSLVDSDGDAQSDEHAEKKGTGIASEEYGEGNVICYANSTHAYTQSNTGEIGFQKGDRVALFKEEGEWWFVRDRNGALGWVPGSYFLKEGGFVSPSLVLAAVDAATAPAPIAHLPVTQEMVAEKPPIPSLAKSSSKSSINRNSTTSNSSSLPILQQQLAPVSYITKSLQSIPSEEVNQQQKSESSSEEEDEVDGEEESEEDESEEEEEEEEEESSDPSEEEEDDGDQDDVSEDVKHVLSTLKKRKSLNTHLRHLPLSKLDADNGPSSTTAPAIDNLPLGFRPSTLSSIRNSGEVYLLPELKRHGLGFRDLALHAKTQTVRKKKVECQFGVGLREIVNVGNAAPLDILGRGVRVCVWDREAVVSNVHTIAGWRELNVWRFREKGTSVFAPNSGGEGEFFVRVGGGGEPDGTLALLFEMFLVVKGDVEGQSRQVSCGWSVLSLYRADGEVVEAGGYEIPVHGGRPGEMDVDLAPPVNLVGGGSARGLFSGKANSGGCRLKVAVWKLNRTATDTANDLPDIFVGSMISLPVLAFYRRVLANVLIGNQGDSRDAVSGSKYEPILALVPKLVESHDLTGHLATGWAKRLKGMSRRDKRSYTALKNHFTSVLMSIWPLQFIDMPPLIPGNSENGLIRSEIWQKIQREGIVSFLSKPSLTVREFGVEELEYDYLKSFRCLYHQDASASTSPIVKQDTVLASGRVTPLAPMPVQAVAM